jgi:hypothetical protein
MKVKDGKCVYDFMGIINSWIVNRQYYTYKIKSNENIRFEQLSKNKFGSDVMEVLTNTGIPVGHLSAKTASYLKPLVESGAIYVDGNTVGKEKDEAILVILHVKLIEGSLFLKQKRARNAESILHNQILAYYVNKERYSLETITKLGDYYYPVMKGKDIYPETKLLYHLTTFKSFFDERINPMIEKMEKKQNVKNVQGQTERPLDSPMDI